MAISRIGSSKIQSIGSTSAGAGANNATDVVQNVQKSFSQILENLDATQKGSDDLLQRLAAGEDVDLHQLMIATEETDINFRVAMSIRDRLVDAYREIMRMTV